MSIQELKKAVQKVEKEERSTKYDISDRKAKLAVCL